MSRMTWVRAWVRPMPMWWSRPSSRRVTRAGVVDAVVADAVVGVGGRGRRGWLWGGRCRRWRGWPGAGRERWGRLVVVVVDEGVEQGLELGDGGGLVGLGAQPFLQGLLEPFDLAAGGGVVGAGVLLGDAEAAEFGLEAVAAAAAAGEAGGEDHAVVGQRGGGDPVLGDGCRGRWSTHDRAGDPAVGGDGQGVAGVVVEPGQDLGVGAGRRAR